MPSLKTNVLLNLINTFTSILMPVVTFPYATRVLGLEGIGIINFQASVSNYIVLITGLGIPMYAVKEVARYRDDIRKRNLCVLEITTLSLLLCLVGYVAAILLGCFVPRIQENLPIFAIFSLTIFFTAIGVNWFYQAIEDFVFITIRAIVFKVLVAASLFIFVHSADDLISYALIMVSLAVGNNFINFIHLRKYFKWKDLKWKKMNIVRHIKPTLQIYLPYIITNIYGNLNIVMIGFMQSDAAVGIYTAANKLTFVVLTVVTSLSVVLLPRCSNLIEKGNLTEFKQISLKSIHLVIATALPAATGMMLLADPLVRLFCGSAFGASAEVVYTTAPVILLIGLSNVIGIQIFYPENKAKFVIFSTLGGAIINMLLNFALIPHLSYMGAAYSTIIAELCVLIIQYVLGRKYVPFSFKDLKILNYIIASVLMGGGIILTNACIDSMTISFFTCAAIGTFIYAATLLCLKDAIMSDIVRYAAKLIPHKNGK